MERQVYDRMSALEGSHWWFTARREILAAELARLKLPADGAILEVGCGTGGNLEMLGRFGRLVAVEPDAQARAYAQARSGAPVRAGSLPELSDVVGPFDLVAAFDVVEHVDDDTATLAALAAQAKPGGHVIFTVPAYQWMWSGHDVRHHHKRRYTAAACRALMTQAGLRVRRLTYFNSLLFPPIAAVRLVRRLLGRPGPDDEQQPAAPLNRLLHGVFAAERGLLAWTDLPFGVSILAIGERPP
jgi:SAM-dependent methyltransferase